MIFSAFLDQLAQALEEPADPVAPATETIPRVLYDPTRWEAQAPDQILIGLGLWQQAGRPVEHRGICLNNKGIAERFGGARRHATVTDLVLDPPEALSQHWTALTAAYPGPVAILRQFTLIVEDAGPDACFALLCWLARCAGVDVGELREGATQPWIRAVRDWETTGMTEDPMTSWAALLSTLGHSHLPTAGMAAPKAERQAQDFSQGWREALSFTVALLRQGADPNRVPPAWHLRGYTRARAFLEVERREYLDSLEQAVQVQLWVPLAAANDHRLLVDAYFAVETWPSGARKLFIRGDREHTHLRQGFALMGLHRPGERGSGGDMTLSVNPWTGIHLQALWQELERLETERWRGQRPRDRIRPIASYPTGTGYNQPWWDDGGRYSLLGAPKALPNWPAGSRLDWPEVLEAVWHCYGPLRGLRVRDLLEPRDCLLTACQREVLPTEDGALAKHLVAAGWLPDDNRPQALFLAPTSQRALMALAIREPVGAPLALADLPPEREMTRVPLAGGFALIHERGVFLFDDWRPEPLPLEALREEIRRCARWLGVLREVEGQLAADSHSHAPETALNPWRALGTLTELAARRTRLASAQYRYAPASPNPEARRFRAQLLACWGIDKTAEELQRRLTQMEDAIRTSSALRTQGLVQILSVYGLPFFISGGISGLLAPGLEEILGKTGATPYKLALYLGLAAALITLARLVQARWTRGQASKRVGEEARPASQATDDRG